MSKIEVATIDTSVPIPEKVAYPFEQLKVGESFAVVESKRASVQSRATRLKVSTGKEFLVKKTQPGEIRVWRTK